MQLPSLQGALLLSLALTEAVDAAKPKNAILLSEVRTLTLRADKKTTHRRVSAIPQLRCVSPKAVCDLHKVDTMRCTNQGSSYGTEDVEWSCTASLPPELKLGSTEVICEGYAGPEDPYVLRGSCGVEYRLVLTNEGERKYPNLGGGGGFWGGGGSGGGGGGTDWSAWLFFIIFVGVLGWIVYSAFAAAGGNAQTPGRRRPRGNFWGGGGGWGPGWGPGGGGGGGGGGFGGGYDDPPPPYPGSKPSGATQGGWQPGFWSGLAGGAAAGYFAGRRNDDRSGYRAGSDRGFGGSSWGAGPSNSGSRSGSSSSSTSTARYESTGFGSTSRR